MDQILKIFCLPELGDSTERGGEKGLLEREIDSSVPMQTDGGGDAAGTNGKDYEGEAPEVSEAHNRHGLPLSEGDTKIDE